MQQQQPNQSQSQPPVFQEPPQVLTGKDFNYFKDMLSVLETFNKIFH